MPSAYGVKPNVKELRCGICGIIPKELCAECQRCETCCECLVELEPAQGAEAILDNWLAEAAREIKHWANKLANDREHKEITQADFQDAITEHMREVSKIDQILNYEEKPEEEK